MFGMLHVITEKRHKQAPILPDDTRPQNYHSIALFRHVLQQRWYHQEVSSTLESKVYRNNQYSSFSTGLLVRRFGAIASLRRLAESEL